MLLPCRLAAAGEHPSRCAFGHAVGRKDEKNRVAAV